jgi:hypothetical protein
MIRVSGYNHEMLTETILCTFEIDMKIYVLYNLVY